MRKAEFIFAALVALFSASCRKDVVINSQTYAVEVIYSVSGLGDLGFQDNIYSGFRKCQSELGEFVLESYFPKSTDEAEGLIQDWIDEGKNPGLASIMTKRLLVIAEGTYAQLFDKHPEWGNTENNDILLLDQEESKYNVYSINLPMYGACYLAGEVVCDFGAKKVACVVANNVFDVLGTAAQGFIDGYRDSGGSFDEATDYYSLSDSISGGFSEADSLYRMSYAFAEKGYRFVFTIAGGSSQGLLRYTRQHSKEENCFYTNGMDVDQQAYSDRVAFSVIKEIDDFCYDFLKDWMEGKSIPKHRMLGLESGYVDVLPSTAYEKYVNDFEAERKKAIQAENAFYQ